MRYLRAFCGAETLKSGVHFTLTVRLTLGSPHFKYSRATCTTPRVNLDVNCGLWVVMMTLYTFSL